MKFAKVVFWIAGGWGVVVLTPLYFIFDKIGQQDPPPITHPAFYYGFAGVALVWQFAFFVIGTDPARFRPIMIPAILEKFIYGATVAVLYLQNRLHMTDLALGAVDTVLGVLFAIAFFKTRSIARNAAIP
jgi:hypothetical protein